MAAGSAGGSTNCFESGILQVVMGVKRKLVSLVAADLEASIRRINVEIVGPLEVEALNRRFAETNQDFEFDSDLASLEFDLGYRLELVGERLLIQLDALGMHAARADFVEKWSGLRGVGLSKYSFGYNEDDGEHLDSIALRYLREFKSSLDSLTGETDGALVKSYRAQELERLSHTLRSTARLLHSFKIRPRKESDIQSAMNKHLSGFYTDYSTNVAIAKPLKSFKPDAGIPLLHAAIEFKFAGSEAEVKVAMSGITEDLSGYAGSKDWRHFFSVIYMTGPWAVEGQFAQALGMSGNAGAWTTILVTGRGGRARKAKEAGTA
jgi:hypothetical protein